MIATNLIAVSKSLAQLTAKQARKRNCRSEMNKNLTQKGNQPNTHDELVQTDSLFFQEGLRDAKSTQGLCCYIRIADTLNKNCGPCDRSWFR
jgi:hypothetical protein